MRIRRKPSISPHATLSVHYNHQIPISPIYTAAKPHEIVSEAKNSPGGPWNRLISQCTKERPSVPRASRTKKDSTTSTGISILARYGLLPQISLEEVEARWNAAGLTRSTPFSNLAGPTFRSSLEYNKGYCFQFSSFVLVFRWFIRCLCFASG